MIVRRGLCRLTAAVGYAPLIDRLTTLHGNVG
jgi:hypothetical protein